MTGEYQLIKTNLGKEVYTRLLTDFEQLPQQPTSVTWQQRILELHQHGGELLENPQTEGSITQELEESKLLPPHNGEKDYSTETEAEIVNAKAK
jgi:hypothetical protein